jgi:hypothetical protein
MRAVVLVVVAVVPAVTACSSSSVVADAAPARDPGTGYTPVTITGTSPQGPLDIFHYARAGYVDGFCPEGYLITITPRPASVICYDCYNDPRFMLGVSPPFGVGGPHAAFASVDDGHINFTENVTFEPTQLDVPTAPSPRITGRFVSNDPLWSFDITVDLVSQFSDPCI